ncbi:MAG: bile acid:sodium symporter family protein [Thiogranum sp.]
MIVVLTRAFPLWALAFATLAWSRPELFTSHKPAIVPLLALVMFGMGLTLRADDFRRVLARPATVGLGVLLQYGCMPLFAWLIALSLKLDPLLLTGMVLVGTCPGGTASNVICYLAGGDVALSITLTAVSTLLSVVMTPLLCLLYIDTAVGVPAVAMLLSILKIVIAPVVAGILLNRWFHDRLEPLRHRFPLLSVAAIVWIIAIIVALNQPRFDDLGWLLVVAVMAHNTLGLLAGYAVARALGHDRRISRTLAIEVGMQNSGLAVALAIKFFAPAAALPGALFSVWHNLSGSLLAARWRNGASTPSR